MPEETVAAPPGVPSGGGAELTQAAEGVIPQLDEGGGTYTVAEYVAYVVQDADREWTEWFTTHGMQEPYVEWYVIPDGGTWDTDCGKATDPPDDANLKNMYYCSVDGDGQVQQPNEGRDANGSNYDPRVPGSFRIQPTPEELADGENEGALIFPENHMADQWEGEILGPDRPERARVIGDFAAGFTIAHEFGHHVQDEWWRQYNAQMAAQGQPGVKEPTGKWKELLADCFAGAWAYTAFYNGVLEPGDMDEAIAAWELIGDRVGPNGELPEQPHGTAQERVQALLDGYNTGDPLVCNEKYWITEE